MKTLQQCLLGLSLLVLVSCSKNDFTSTPSANAVSLPDTTAVQHTDFGVLIAQAKPAEVQQQVKRAGIQLVRAQVIYSEASHSKTVDTYLESGLHVIINFNWKQTLNTVPFPTNPKLIRDSAEAFFKYYTPYKKQIPVVVVENEWDNMGYHAGDIHDYLAELYIVTEVAHKYGFKTSGAGITSKGLNLWMASKTSGDTAVMWQRMAGSTGNMGTYVKRVNTYIDGIKSIDADYVNVHWYNDKAAGNRFRMAAHAYRNACGKKQVICNEFGIKTSSPELFKQTVQEIKGHVSIAVAYSGINTPGKAVKLTDEMLAQLKK